MFAFLYEKANSKKICDEILVYILSFFFQRSFRKMLMSAFLSRFKGRDNYYLEKMRKVKFA